MIKKVSMQLLASYGLVMLLIWMANRTEVLKARSRATSLTADTLVSSTERFLRGVMLVSSFFLPTYGMSYLVGSFQKQAFIPSDWVVLLVGLGGGMWVWMLLFMPSARMKLSVLFNQHYQPYSMIHLTAILIMIYSIGVSLIDYWAGGGLEGLADELAIHGISTFDLLLQLGVFVSIAFLGVGAGVRRDLSATLERLGIRFPTVGDWVWGGITALLCLALLVAFSLWNQAINPTEITDQQAIASDQLMVALGQSYAMAGLAALSAGVGEEVLFRGALQPVFGILPTAIFFGLLHSQYLFTPLLLLVILLGCVMGMLRRLRNTTSAIIAHFSYNFIQLTLFIWANNLTTPSALSGLNLLEKVLR